MDNRPIKSTLFNERWVMHTRFFHGDIEPKQLANALLAHFNRGNLRAQQFGDAEKIAVQISSRSQPTSGGYTALTISITKIEDGVAIQIGKQAWLGVAASLGMTALAAWRNPWSILSRLDDVAQDLEYIQLTERVWEVIQSEIHASNASYELSERLRRIVCSYCQVANPVGESNCIACGAPLGPDQPKVCMNCGFVIKAGEVVCSNCGQPVD